MFKKLTLKNNLRVLLIPLKDSKSVSFSFYVRAGSRFENEKNSGIAHFLEHMAFKGTKKYPTQFDLSKFVEGLGADWDAGTGNEYIQYYLRAEASQIKVLTDILNEMLFHSLYKESDIEKEKGVIIEEINMYHDIPEQRVAILVDELMWPNHPLGRNIAGTKENVSSFKHKDFIDYRNGLFAASNMVIGVSGKFDEDEVLALLEKAYSVVPDFKVHDYEKVNDNQNKPRVVVEHRKSEQVNLCLNFKTFGRNDPQKFTLTLLSMILGGGFSSRLFQKIRTELGLAYYIGSFAQYFMDTGVFQISAGVNTKSTIHAIQKILEELENFTKTLDASEIERVKSHYKGVLALRLEDHGRLNRFISEQELLSQKVFNYEGVIKEIESVTKDDIRKVATDIFTNAKLNLAIVGDVPEQAVKDIAHF